ncbi:protein DEPP-like [Anguilla rostrata]|uniref:protein DEPP-like n=1 Tax=Anguilla rostrata TaxID=7938 RepID=UPI0030D22A67
MFKFFLSSFVMVNSPVRCHTRPNISTFPCRMKPRRLLLSVGLLPTISETHEEVSQAGPAAQAHQSLEDYVDSIKELAQPAAVPGCGPLRVQRTQRPRLFAKHAPPASASRRAVRVRRPRAAVCQDGVALKCDGRTDPVDWLFAQTQTQQDVPTTRENIPAALCLL